MAGYLIATMEHNGATEVGVLSEAFAEHLEDFRKNFLQILQREIPRDVVVDDPYKPYESDDPCYDGQFKDDDDEEEYW